MKVFNTIFILLFVVFFSCKKDTTDNPQRGEILVLADDSFKNVTEALTERYMAFYPETKIKVAYKKEDLAFLDLLENKARVIVMSRELTTQEKESYKHKVDLKLEPARFAGDAVCFVVPRNSTIEQLTIAEIKNMLLSEEKKFIFDGTNASNLNFVAQKFKMKPSELKFSIIKGNENVINGLDKFPNKIGVVSLNTISRPYSPEAKKLRDKVKILKIVENGIAYEPTTQNIRNMSYPFTRILYFLTNEGYFGLGNGFIRFSCTQIGQIVVSKQGLQPYNIYKRQVQFNQ